MSLFCDQGYNDEFELFVEGGGVPRYYNKKGQNLSKPNHNARLILEDSMAD